MKVTTADDIALMMGKFRTNVEFSDAPNGFFGFVRETFDQLKKEEEYAADWQDLDCPLYPSFGHKDDTYEDVVREFYGIWSGFSTRKSFAWKDKWRLSEAPDRRTRRLMEKENLKAREEGQREFNDAVRNLLLFVRKRDPRYTPNTQTAAEREKAQRDLAKKQAARAKAARAAQSANTENAIPEWALRRDPDEEEEESEEEIEEEHFECVACNKTFKSERQWEAHEKSKKHQKAINALRRKMQKENAYLDLDDDDVPAASQLTPMDDEIPEDRDDVRLLNGDADDLADEVDDLELDDKLSNPEDSEEDASDADQVPAKAKSKKKSKSKSSPAREPSPSSSASDSSPSDDEYAPRSEVESRFDTATTAPTSAATFSPSDDETPTHTGTSTPKLGKAAQKRAKKAAQQAALDASDQKHKCAVCNEAFPSKTKLFSHIKEEDHAAPVSVTKGWRDDDEGWGGKKAKKKGRRK